MRRAATVLLMAALGTGSPLAAQSGPQSPAGGATQTATHGPLELRLTTDRAEMTTAQVLRLSLRVSAPDGYSVTPPAVGETIGDFAVLARDERPARLEAGRLIFEMSYTLEPFLAGAYTIPSLEITYAKLGGATPSVATTGELTVKVASLLADDAKLDPGAARAVMGVGMPASAVTLIVAASAAMVLAGGAAGMIVLRRRTRAAERVADQIESLRRDGEAGKASVTDLCDRGSALVRRAFEARIAGASALTTDELIGAAPRAGITEHELAQLRDFLRACDAVRYAGEPADRDSFRSLLSAMVGVAAHVERPVTGEAKGAPR